MDVFELLRHLVDPEKPNCTLEQLDVIRLDLIEVVGADDTTMGADSTIITYVPCTPRPRLLVGTVRVRLVAGGNSQPWPSLSVHVCLRAGCCSIRRCLTAHWREILG